MENENKTETDKILANLERMLENTPEKSRQPIVDLIKKRKVELGILKSELPSAGYQLKKRANAKQLPKESKESLQKIATRVGRVPETDLVTRGIDVKDAPLKKDIKALEADSYKY